MAINFDYDPKWKPAGGTPDAGPDFDYDPAWKPTAPAPASGGLVASAKQAIGSTINGAGQLAADFIPGVGQDNAVTRYGKSVVDANPTRVTDFASLKDNPLTAVTEATGNAAGSMGAMLGARALGQGITAVSPLAGPAAPLVAGLGQAVSWAGPAAVAALPSFGGIREKQIQKDPNAADSTADKLKAAIGAGAVGAIESRFGPQEWAMKAMTKEGRNALAEKFAANSLAGSVAKGAAKGAAIEGAEELAQNPTEQVAAGDNPLTAESLKETAFGGVMGALGGGVLGGAGGAGFRKRPEAAAQPAATPANPTAAPSNPLAQGPIDYQAPSAEELASLRKAELGVDPANGPISSAAALSIENQTAEEIRLGKDAMLAQGAAAAQQSQAELDALRAADPGIPFEAPEVGRQADAEGQALGAVQGANSFPVEPTGNDSAAEPIKGLGEVETPPSAKPSDAIQSAVSDAATRAIQAGLSIPDGKAAVEQSAQEQITRSAPDLVRQFADAAAKNPAIMRRVAAGTPEQMETAMTFAVPVNTPQRERLMRNSGFVSAMQDAIRQAAAAQPAKTPLVSASGKTLQPRQPQPNAQQNLPQAAPAQAQQAETQGQEQPAAVNQPPAAELQPTNSLSKTASWVVRNKETKEVLFETYDQNKVDALNSDKYEAVPILAYLQSINGKEPVNGAARPPAGSVSGGSDSQGSVDARSVVDNRADRGSGYERKGEGDATAEPAPRVPSAGAGGKRAKSTNLLKIVRDAGGVSAARKNDVAQDSRAVGVFRSGGMELDSLAELLHQNGFLTDADVSDSTSGAEKAVELLREAIAGNRPLNMADSERAMSDAQDAEHKESIRKRADELGVKWRFRKIEDVEKDVEARELRNQLDEDSGALEWENVPIEVNDFINEFDYFNSATPLKGDAAARALGFTDDEIKDLQFEPGKRKASGADTRAAETRNRANQTGDSQAGILESYTEQDLAASDEAQRLAAETRAKQEKAADDKARADAERDSFTLTGSDRPADVMAAMGQGGLFDATAATPKQDVSLTNEGKTTQAVETNGESSLATLFSDLDSTSTRKANKASRAAQSHPKAAEIDYVQKNFHDVLLRLMEEGKLTVNGVSSVSEENSQCL